MLVIFLSLILSFQNFFNVIQDRQSGMELEYEYLIEKNEAFDIEKII
jgi:hypothetical protein